MPVIFVLLELFKGHSGLAVIASRINVFNPNNLYTSSEKQLQTRDLSYIPATKNTNMRVVETSRLSS
jgi:hypothetical protein